MKYYTILKNDKIVELDKADLKELKSNLTGQNALDIAKSHNLRLPFIFEVVDDIESNAKLKQILIDGWIWTNERYKERLSGLYLSGACFCTRVGTPWLARVPLVW